MRHISMSETSKGGLWSGSDVRYGPLADIAALPNVRFTPKADIAECHRHVG